MRPVDLELKQDLPFGWSSTTYAKDQTQYLPLPVIRSASIRGHVVSRWKLSWRERLRVLFSGDIWLMLLTFHEPLQPVKISTLPFDLSLEYARLGDSRECNP